MDLLRLAVLEYENAQYALGAKWIAGVDEAGRGPLAGPVVAAAVILPRDVDLRAWGMVRDSKELSEAAREACYETIIHQAAGYAAGHATPREIEQLNIRRASLLAMQRAVERLPRQPDYVLVDGRDYPEIGLPGAAVIHGDRLSLSIGAASIVAKVVRDRWMTALHRRYPCYGLHVHKGYPTAYHRAALQLFGPSEIHRRTYQGVKEYLEVKAPAQVCQEILELLQNCISAQEAKALRDRIEQDLTLTIAERIYLGQSAGWKAEEMERIERAAYPTNVEKGRKYEQMAMEYLNKKDYQVWERNYHGREGEIDLIANRGAMIVFVEVKARKSERFGMPHESVTDKKKMKLIRTAEQYLYERGLSEEWDIRYDVISILAKRGQPVVIEHYEDAFRPDEVKEWR